MKKFILSTLAASALAAGGGAWAQDGGAGCQAGSAYGVTPGCRFDNEQQLYSQPGWGTGVGAVVIPQVLGALGLPNVVQNFPQRQAGQLYTDQYGRRFYMDQYGRQVWLDNGSTYAYGSAGFPITSRDRDGDGVRNRDDRYPDDPRYR